MMDEKESAIINKMVYTAVDSLYKDQQYSIEAKSKDNTKIIFYFRHKKVTNTFEVGLQIKSKSKDSILCPAVKTKKIIPILESTAYMPSTLIHDVLFATIHSYLDYN